MRQPEARGPFHCRGPFSPRFRQDFIKRLQIRGIDLPYMNDVLRTYLTLRKTVTQAASGQTKAIMGPSYTS